LGKYQQVGYLTSKLKLCSGIAGGGQATTYFVWPKVGKATGPLSAVMTH